MSDKKAPTVRNVEENTPASNAVTNEEAPTTNSEDCRVPETPQVVNESTELPEKIEVPQNHPKVIFEVI